MIASETNNLEKLSKTYGNLIGRVIRILCRKISDMRYTTQLVDNDWKAELESVVNKMIEVENSQYSPQLKGIHSYCSDPIQLLLSDIENVRK